jgi:mycofactocin system FadH/OYE family oxidoreductase 1
MTTLDALLEPWSIRGHHAPNRVMFGPIVTNLGDDERQLTPRHVAFYERRARGGCGVIVVEGASVHDSDWPYERAPLASRCSDGWSRIAAAVHRHGSLVLASLDHTGGQGSSAYSQAPLWAPSRVPEVNSREVPKWMESHDIAAVVDGFARAATAAVAAGCDGVEINAGQHSLIRQFMSGLTNHRDDAWGGDRLKMARDVIAAVRTAVGDTAIVSLRLSCDELAPWAGITPEMAPAMAAELTAGGVDMVVVTRGSIFSASMTRPDFHQPSLFNRDVCAAVRAAVPTGVQVVLQGSVIDPAAAADAVTAGVCDGVEMTRAQLADPDMVAKLVDGRSDRVRPCLLCNQTCQVRDPRNPIITCVVEPSTGHETTDPLWTTATTTPRDVLVLGAGPTGLEAARVAAVRGHRVTVIDVAEHAGGLAAVSGPGGPLVAWQAHELEHLGVPVQVGRSASDTELADAQVVVQCTGSRTGKRTFDVAHNVAPTSVLDIADLRRGLVTLPADGDVVVHDPIGGPIAVALAEELGDRAILVTPDQIAGNELARTGDLAPANVRLAQRGVRIQRRSVLRSVERDPYGADSVVIVTVQDRFSGERHSLPATAVVDCGFRLPTAAIAAADLQAGDCVAPRTLLEAILEGRRAALAVDGV